MIKMSSLANYTCPICMSIFIEPVVMPCYHEICMPCFKANVEKASLCCPLCRMRISSWARKATKNNTLVNEKRWLEVRRMFPDKVQKRLDGDDDDEEIEVYQQFPSVRLAQPGELKEEYERELEKVREEREKEARKESEASEALILKLQEEEELERAKSVEIAKRDEELAKELSSLINEAGIDSPMGFLIGETKRRINTRSDSTNSTVSSGQRYSGPLEKFLTNKSHSSSPSSENVRRSASMCSDKSISSMHFDSPQPSHTNSKDSSLGFDVDVNNSLQNLQVSTSRTSSSMSDKTEDSITHEISHFKPIEICPKTPPKKLANGKSLDPPLIRTTPINLTRVGFESPTEKSLSDIDASSPIMQRRLSELAEERKQHVKEFSKSTSTFSQSKVLPQKCLKETPSKNVVDVENKESEELSGFKSENLILPYDVDLQNVSDESDSSQKSFDSKRGKKSSKKVSISDETNRSGLRSPDIKDWLMGRYVKHHVDPGVKPVILDYNDNDLITDESGDHKSSKLKSMKLSTKTSCKENTMHNYFQSLSKSDKKTQKRKIAENRTDHETNELDLPCSFRKRSKSVRKENDIVNSENNCSLNNRLKRCIKFSTSHSTDVDSDMNSNTKLCVRTNSENTDEDLDVFESQEEKDRLYALELQKQFELEVRYGVNADRLKGGTNTYSFRNRPK